MESNRSKYRDRIESLSNNQLITRIYHHETNRFKMYSIVRSCFYSSTNCNCPFKELSKLSVREAYEYIYKIGNEVLESMIERHKLCAKLK